jgi:F1F0 ATPase subunit 2
MTESMLNGAILREFATLDLQFFAGVALGAIFFGGLWWTIRRGVSSQVPGLLFAGSLLLRTSVTVGGFYFVSHGDWRKLVACLLGFITARIFVTRLTRVPMVEPVRFQETSGQ